VLGWHYVSDLRGAFNSVEHILRESNYCWLIRYLQPRGASMFSPWSSHIFVDLLRIYKAPRELLDTGRHYSASDVAASIFFWTHLPWGQMKLRVAKP